MKKIIISISIVVVLLATTMFFLFTGDNNRVVEDTFDAQMKAIKGDNSELEKLGIKEDYSSKAKTQIDNMGFGDFQDAGVERAYEEFTYKIVEVKEINNTTFELIYEIDSYPIVSSMSDYTLNTSNYLTKEEEAILNDPNSPPEQSKEVVDKLLSLYEEGLKTLEPEKQVYKVTYIVEDNVATLENPKDFANMVNAVVGMSVENQYKEEK